MKLQWRRNRKTLCACSALYTPGLGDTQLDMLDTHNKIEQLLPFDPGGPKQPVEALLATLAQLEKDLRNELKMKQDILPPASSSAPPPPQQPAPPNAAFAIFNEEQKYTNITTPASLSSQYRMIKQFPQIPLIKPQPQHSNSKEASTCPMPSQQAFPQLR